MCKNKEETVTCVSCLNTIDDPCDVYTGDGNGELYCGPCSDELFTYCECCDKCIGIDNGSINIHNESGDSVNEMMAEYFNRVWTTLCHECYKETLEVMKEHKKFRLRLLFEEVR